MSTADPAPLLAPPATVPPLAHHRILVVGDIFLDEYQIGRVQRLSREAPVPVLEQTERRYLPGGAANPAANIASMGSEALLIGVRGDDHHGHQLQEALTRQGLRSTSIVIDTERHTTCKTRIIAAGSYVFAHHLARVDRIDRRPLSPATEAKIIARLHELLPTCAAVLVSDYGVNVITPGIIAALRQLAQQHHVLTVVDSQGDLGQFRGFDLIRCNRQEAERFSGQSLSDDAGFSRVLHSLRPQLQARNMVISRGQDGLSLLGQGDVVRHLPPHNRSQVFDVTGAGDTLIAIITLALVAGCDLATAAALGNVAAGVVVQHLGTVAVTPRQLQAALDGDERR